MLKSSLLWDRPFSGLNPAEFRKWCSVLFVICAVPKPPLVPVTLGTETHWGNQGFAVPLLLCATGFGWNLSQVWLSMCLKWKMTVHLCLFSTQLSKCYLFPGITTKYIKSWDRDILWRKLNHHNVSCPVYIQITLSCPTRYNCYTINAVHF